MSIRVLLLTSLIATAGWLSPVVTPSAWAQDDDEETSARYLVIFRTGRTMEVVGIQTSPEWPNTWRLELPAGGRVTLPRQQVLRVEEIALEAPPAVNRATLGRWGALIERSAKRHGLDPLLVAAIIAVESAGDPKAVSNKGAVGLMQVLPTTAADYGVTELTDPRTNIDVGCRHLARLLEQQDGNIELALAAYNAGEGAVAKAGGIPRFRETRHYVETVTRRYQASLATRR